MKQLFTLFLLACLCSCGNNPGPDNGPTGPVTHNADEPATMSYSIVNTYPHDTSSFTEGLMIYKGQLFESTGNYGTSHLVRSNLQTGAAEQKIPLDKKYFGEGISIIRDTVYQLTYKEHAVLVYTLPDFKFVKELKFGTDGWGMTTDGKELIVGDGTSTLYYYDPTTFNLLRTQSITDGGTLAYNINELEYIDGFIYANQWQQPYILKIDPGAGKVVAKANLGEVWDRVKQKYPGADVPNGIAYDSVGKKIYVTGKLWPELYEVRFGN